MSRGLGKTQRAIMELLERQGQCDFDNVYVYVYDSYDRNSSQRAAVSRAVKSLRKSGKVIVRDKTEKEWESFYGPLDNFAGKSVGFWPKMIVLNIPAKELEKKIKDYDDALNQFVSFVKQKEVEAQIQENKS